ncbi:putative alkaline shock family protein YloU [Friedmanniella endophytica]|uniref:Putative alkaline shock family protein YloU n=1 Tax=Microlunatus kandeliicorticis TaxID=1759536 RepID=A0A7W3IVL2_9ACTN|nr:Asp23/Gls24 family envelope stress response protein [Microlunatus kandeliicorticis]MBA8795925.1 putative alkaline shock family protein YloU [Microlunatus kandeliicorticis]
MSTAAPALAGHPGRGTSDAARRGRLVLADGVVEKIAAQVVAEVGVSYGTSGGFLGIGAKADRSARPKVDVDLSTATNTADLAISVGIAYPASLRRATDQIRSVVAERVARLTGVQVRRVDIDVEFLAVPGAERAAEGRDGRRELR